MQKLRLYFLGFFLLLAAPFAFLLSQTYANLEQESYFFYRRAAQGAERNLSASLLQMLETEQRRPYTQYRYLYVPDQPLPQQEGLNVSPLAAYPVGQHIPGLLGYFQVDPDGNFSTPLLPGPDAAAGLSVPRYPARKQLQERLALLVEGRRPWSSSLWANRPQDAKSTPESENYLDRLDRSLENRYRAKESSASPAASPKSKVQGIQKSERQVQKSTPEQARIFDSLEDRQALGMAGTRPEASDSLPAAAEEDRPSQQPPEPSQSQNSDAGGYDLLSPEVTAEVDPFQVNVVDGEWLVFHRKVWWQDRRYVQGFVARAAEFFEQLLGPAVQNSALPADTGHLVFYGREVITPANASAMDGMRVLWESNLPAAFGQFQVVFAVAQLPEGPGRSLVNATALLLTLLLVAGSAGMYRLSASHLELSQKKSDFVSAVTHELKTPLASIRMYGEMLVEGWVGDEDKRQSYYRHIHEESERLSRLIQNVLRLSQLERGEWQVELSAQDPVALIQQAVDRFGRQARAGGFDLVAEVEGEPRPIQVDPDAFTQILINLVDNAIKFSGQAETRQIVITVKQQQHACAVRVRDFGPGIPRGQATRIFEKFYRIDDEMTRSTRGTGIGLALVQILARAMHATVEVHNRRPGSEFTILFPN